MDMTVPEAASRLGVSKDAVRRAIKRGKMKARVEPGALPRPGAVGRGSPPGSGGTLGGHYIVSSDEVERYARERQRQPGGKIAQPDLCPKCGKPRHDMEGDGKGFHAYLGKRP